MAQPTDIVLDGAGYMLAPGTYQRAQDGMAEGRTGRIVFRDFFGGLKRHLQLERDRGFDGDHIGPALNGQGVQPWAVRSGPYSMPSGTAQASADIRVPSVICGGRLHVALGARLIKFDAPGGASLGPATLYTAAGNILDMCLYSSNGMILALGSGHDIIWVRSSDAMTAPVLADERATAIGGYGGYAVYRDARTAARPTYVRQVTGTQVETRILDYDIERLENAGASIYAITAGAIYEYRGRVRTVQRSNPAYTGVDSTEPPTVGNMEWTGDWEPFFQHGVTAEPDDFRFFVGFGGNILAWVAGEAMEYKPTGERAGWRATGLTGRRCFGGCVAGGYAVVSIESHEGRNELWAWDGSGWWKIASQPMAATGYWIWPTNLNDTARHDLMCFKHGSAQVDIFRLHHRSGTVHAFSPTAEFITPMIDAGERDKAKAWRRIGATFSSPERFGDLASTDNVACYLDFSLDGGATWTQAAGGFTHAFSGVEGNAPGAMTFGLDAAIGATSRWIMLRVRWQGVSGWAPILTGLWAEYEILDSPARRRTWAFDIVAQDQVINRAGAPLATTGRQLIAGLWESWETGSTVAFRDIDYDAAAIERTVRIVGIAEKAARPADHGRWGDSVVSLRLVEV